ncbi:NAD(P)H-hydrate epimerase, partial [Rhodobacteraceae bacterium WD3A24]
MGEFLTSAQMRAIESAAMTRDAATGAELMERAGRGVVAAIGAHFPALAQVPGRAAVLCGPGNNGGDGFVVARLLADRGWRVGVWMFGARDRLPPDAALNARRWEAIGPVRPLEALCADDLAGVDLVVDAFFGTGLGRAVPEEVVRALGWARAGRLVAVDILSGIDADDGRLHGPPDFPDVVADLTVSFQCAKLGHVLGEGARRSRALAVADIGLGADLAAWREAHPAALCEAVDIPDRAAWDKPVGAHKYCHGHALVLGGGAGQGGAARLAARAAL